MSISYTDTESKTFTVTDARHIAAKVATDLKRMQRFYGKPSDSAIAAYEGEVIALLKAGYLNSVSYGFMRHNKWIEPMLQYTAHELGNAVANDDDPGRVYPGANVSGASFYSFLTYSAAWFGLSDVERSVFKKSLSVQRSDGCEPAINGYLESDRTYSAGGRALARACVRSFS